MTFEREDRYIVLKAKDVLRYLSDENLIELVGIIDRIKAGRTADGKYDLKAVVVEHDWPEYEPVWKMIEDRVEGYVDLPVKWISKDGSDHEISNDYAAQIAKWMFDAYGDVSEVDAVIQGKSPVLTPDGLKRINEAHSQMDLPSCSSYADHEFDGFKHRIYAQGQDGCYICALLADNLRLRAQLEKQSKENDERSV